MNAQKEIEKVLREIAGDDISFALSVPEEKSHGDLATNIAFALSKKLGKSPKVIAEEMKETLGQKISHVISDIHVAGPGFINFFVKKEIVRIESKTVGGIETTFSGKNILVEHSSPNLFKPFNIGHLMNNIIGEFIVRSSKAGKAKKTVAMSFPSDVSLGIAKALYVIELDFKEGTKDINFFIEESGEEDTVIAYLGEAYVRGVKLCEESEEHLLKAKATLEKLYKHTNEDGTIEDEEFYKLVTVTKKINQEYFKKVLYGIGSDIDCYVYESESGNIGSEIVKENTGEGKVFIESEGAIVYIPDESKKDINTSVFINSQGYPTYEAKDVGLIEIKFNGGIGIKLGEEFVPDRSLFVTDAEQVPHFKVVLDAVSKINDEWNERVKKSVHVTHGRMLFKGQKMSSRLGGVPLALDVIETVEEEVRERAGEKIANYSQEEKEKITRQIALSALRIAVLRSKPGLNINFDPETSLSFDGDSGPYLLYTHARCFSLLEKGSIINPHFDESRECSDLERTLLHSNTVIKESVEDIAPQKLVTYLFKVAQEFNSFYAQEQIISDDKQRTEHNLAIVSWTKEVLKQGLYVLGIEAVERM